MLRIYPAATRFNSSNFNPAQFLMLGCQMVALNYQTNGKGFVLHGNYYIHWMTCYSVCQIRGCSIMQPFLDSTIAVVMFSSLLLVVHASS